ncbi:MAG: ABC transporter ATP-binding protein [Gemmatimonadales bacterium]
MTSSGIRFEGVWKKFHRGELHDSLRDLLPALAKKMLGGRARATELQSGDFWAVQDASFVVESGEALGIIGGNGAGKSTILKMLTRILRPTRGWCEVRGRVGALIEVSAGFHQDLTGRENIFLQGAIRGMSSAMIKRQFDSIVEFSGVEDFIDTPVKRYSSGMNARLGFSIAAHLDPEVLIIDEVLAVGDFSFQQKAFDRIHAMATSGIPVVIVSHQLERISTLCTKAILLDHGQITFAGAPSDCILRYTEGGNVLASTSGDGPIRIEEVRSGSDLPVASGSDLAFSLRGFVEPGWEEPDPPAIYLAIRSTKTGSVPYSTTTNRHGLTLPREGPFAFDVTLQMNLAAGIYTLETGAVSDFRGKILSHGPTVTVQIREGPFFSGNVQLNPRLTARNGKGA